MRRQLIKYLPFLLVVLTITGVGQWLKVGHIPTFIVWTVAVWVLSGSWAGGMGSRIRPPWPVVLFLVLVACNAVYGVFMAEGYWDYKNLVSNLLFFLMPSCIFCFSDMRVIQRCSRAQLIALPVLLVLLYLFLYREGIVRLLYIVPFFLLFNRSLSPVSRLYVFVLTLCILLLGDWNSRATLIRLGGTFLLSLLLWISGAFSSGRTFRVGTVLIYVAPVVFLLLAVHTDFNIFKIGEDYEGKYVLEDEMVEGYEADLVGDTRTLIYMENIQSAIQQGYYIWGHSMARGYTTELYSDVDMISWSRSERPDSEVGILNVFTHFGLVGVVLYTLIFIISSFRALSRGRSREMKLLGVWIAFRWMLSWMEEFTMFDINNLYIWIAIAMCWSPAFLQADSLAFRRFINGCFPRVTVRKKDARFRSINEN
ncbi:MAG: hypothetical protein IJ721_08825 [Bacteroidales bacterium]|nr:hypothetical protein [Bacteroidales bacterium]